MDKEFQLLNDEVRLPSEFAQGPKAAILRAACKVSTASGFGGNTLSSVAKAAGLSVQRLRYHYSKLDLIYQDLMKCIFLSGREATMQVLLSRPPQKSSDVILRMVEGLFQWVRMYPHLSRLSPVMSVLAAASKELGPLYEKEFQIGFERLKQALRQAAPHLDSARLEIVSRALHLVMVGMLEDLHRKGDAEIHVDVQEKEALNIIGYLIDSVRVDS